MSLDKDEELKLNIDFSTTYRRILVYLLPYTSNLLVAFFGFTLFALSQPAFAFLMEGFVNALDGTLVDGLYLIPAACVAIALMRGVGSYLGGYYMSKVSESVVHNIRCELFGSILLLPTSYFDNNKSGRLVSLFTYNANVMTATTAKAATTIVREGLTVVALFAYLIYQNFQLTLIFLILGPPLAFAISWIGKRIKYLGHNIQSTVGELNHIVAEVFGGIRMVKSVVAEDTENKRFMDVSMKTKNLGLKLAKINSIYTPMMQMLIILAMAILMYAVLLSRDTMDPASLIAYVTAAALLPKPIRSLSGVHPQLLQGVVAAGEVFRLIDHPKEADEGHLEESIKGEVIFEEVSFTYKANEAMVLKNINFTIKPGNTVALVGRSGGGKSTLINLITRFYLPTFGRILVDGELIQDYRLSFLRKNISVVSQNITLFNLSIAENIAYGLDTLDFDAIEAAARAANAHEFIMDLPETYDTLIGEDGVLLSGGQRQRLAISRAILRDSPILILDEATSALDNEAEVRVQAALQKVMEHRTTIIIAHRLSTIEHADTILVLGEGQIVEQGNHFELMATNDVYAKMVQRDFTE